MLNIIRLPISYAFNFKAPPTVGCGLKAVSLNFNDNKKIKADHAHLILLFKSLCIIYCYETFPGQ